MSIINDIKAQLPVKPKSTIEKKGEYTLYTYWRLGELKDNTSKYYAVRCTKKNKPRDPEIKKSKKEKRDKMQHFLKVMRDNLNLFSSDDLDRMVSAVDNNTIDTMRRLAVVC